MSLISSAELKQYLNITSTDFDTLVTTLLSRVTDAIKTYINRNLESTTYNEIYDGDGSDTLALDNYPIISVAKLSQDIDIEDLTYTSEISNYILRKETGEIVLYDDLWAKVKYSIYVQYTAGYASIPEDIKNVACEWCAKKFYDVKDHRFGITNMNIMAENISFSYTDITKGMQEIMNRYKKPPIYNGYYTSAMTVSS